MHALQLMMSKRHDFNDTPLFLLGRCYRNLGKELRIRANIKRVYESIYVQIVSTVLFYLLPRTEIGTDVILLPPPTPSFHCPPLSPYMRIHLRRTHTNIGGKSLKLIKDEKERQDREKEVMVTMRAFMRDFYTRIWVTYRKGK